MRDTNLAARGLASGSIAGQALIDTFAEERELEFRGERYLVRDNGAVWRCARQDGRRRRLDAFWTFGSLNKQTGYPVLGAHVLHQIVAAAFHGTRPSVDHVVDHIDTNRCNNRADNLRWVTRLENVLLNPITRRRIEVAFGSLEAFFENPGARTVSNLEWMRTVTPEQAKQSRKRLLDWVERGGGARSGQIGDWLFATPGAVNVEPSSPPADAASLTPGALQRNWRTPTEFPLCPPSASGDALEQYLRRLRYGAVFARNRYGDSHVVIAERGTEGIISVLCSTLSGVKDWTLARVFMHKGSLCHEAGGTFFTLQGALKAHCKSIGAPFDNSIDDYA